MRVYRSRIAAGPAYMYLANTIPAGAFAVTLMVSTEYTHDAYRFDSAAPPPPVTIFFGRIILERCERIQQQFGVLSTVAQENLAGVRIVKAYRQESAQADAFRGLSREYMEQNVDRVRRTGLVDPALTLLGGLAMALARGSADERDHQPPGERGGLYARLQRRRLLAEEVGDDMLASTPNDA